MRNVVIAVFVGTLALVVACSEGEGCPEGTISRCAGDVVEVCSEDGDRITPIETCDGLNKCIQFTEDFGACGLPNTADGGKTECDDQYYCLSSTERRSCTSNPKKPNFSWVSASKCVVGGTRCVSDGGNQTSCVP